VRHLVSKMIPSPTAGAMGHRRLVNGVIAPPLPLTRRDTRWTPKPPLVTREEHPPSPVSASMRKKIVQNRSTYRKHVV